MLLNHLILKNQLKIRTLSYRMDDTRNFESVACSTHRWVQDASLCPKIAADTLELKHGLLNLVQTSSSLDTTMKILPSHIRYFNKITSTMKFPNVPSTSVKLMLFPFSLEGAARIWLEKEPPRSIQTWDDLVSKFINKFFPPSKTTNLRNEITRFQQRFDETFYEAWDRFNDLLRACPHHGFSELHQLDTFYNALNSNDQDSLNSAAGGNFLDKMPRDCLRIIESKSKVRNSRNKPVVAKVSSSTSTPGISSEVAELKDMVKALLLDKKNQSPAPTPVKAVEESCVTCGGAHSYQTCPATTGNVYRDNIQEYVSQAAAANYNQGNTGYRAPISNQFDIRVFLRSINHNVQIKEKSESLQPKQKGIYNQAPDLQTRFINVKSIDLRLLTHAYSSSRPITLQIPQDSRCIEGMISKPTTEDVQPPVVPVVHYESISEPINAPVSASMPNQKASIPFPSRRNDERHCEKANDQIEKFYEIFRDLSFEISFTDALMLMPKFASTLKTLIENKEKLSEMARTPLNENCSGFILNKLPKKLGDPGRFLNPCEFSRINTCNALADLELAGRSISESIGIAEDVYVMVGKFQFPADFMVVDFEPDPRVPLILGRSFLKTSRALIDVYEGEITLVVAYGNPSPDYDPIVSNSSPTLTPFGDSDFLLLEEANAFIAIDDEPIS
ncbi:reverse transcriptase domain-containing protein [Tanacetum coccineum]